MSTTRRGTPRNRLQLCSVDPTNLDGAKAALGSVSALTGVHQRVTVRDYGLNRRAAIRTLLVRTDPDGHIEILADGGTYRYLIVGGGTADMHITSPAGTLVDIVDASDLTITATDVSVDIITRSGATTIAVERGTRGRIEVVDGADCTISGAGPELQVVRRTPTVIVEVSPELTRQLIAHVPANPFGLPAATTQRTHP
ncbi:hypothetical protein [Gordonia aichiensis]|uniref:hypothetical protein n=1 Tax=Gordonia aichiensis TaxID=36820 RepID=UPI0032635182